MRIPIPEVKAWKSERVASVRQRSMMEQISTLKNWASTVDNLNPLLRNNVVHVDIEVKNCSFYK